MPSGIYVWSKTAAANSNADSSINWAEGQPPSSVNDSARAVMARIAEYRDDAAGSITTTGTLTAYVAATNQVFASLALMDKKSITIVPHVTSGASPTLAVDGLAPKPLRCATGAALAAPGGTFVAGTPYTVTYFDTAGEFLCDGAGIADGAISNANLAAGAVTGAKIAANTITSANMAAGAIGAGAVSPSFIPVNTCMLNGTIAVLQGGGTMTINIKTLAGADPSASDPTTFIFRDVSASAGDYVVRTVTAALAIPVPSGATLGFVNGLPGRVWLLAIDNGGTVELAVFNAATVTAGTPAGITAIYPLLSAGIITTQTIAAGSLSAGTAYSIAGRTAKAYVPLGYLSWEVGLGGVMGSAGNWNVLPSRVQIFQPGSSPLPGTIVQQAYTSSAAVASGATALPTDNTIPQNTEGDAYLSALSITPSSTANALIVDVSGHFAQSAAGGRLVMALFQDSGANALATTTGAVVGTNTPLRLSIDYQIQVNVSSGVATQFKMRAGGQGGVTVTFNGEAAAAFFGGTLNSGMRITELMT